MKRIALVLPLILLIACSAQGAPEATVAETSDLESQLTDKNAEIAILERQVQSLTEQMDLLQSDYDALLASTVDDLASSSPYLCEVTLENMKYQNPVSAIAILEGWFALQPQVAELQGSYSALFWQDVSSRIHTIRFIDAETGLSETTTFLIFFEEAGWDEGLLNMTDQCWLDFPE